ncbi:MAG: hypothetical protein M1825_005717 [Sarcosagium campestre]|nr:MAG: hypothetical protein M1825_005717 [Sarcosagium campestre]
MPSSPRPSPARSTEKPTEGNVSPVVHHTAVLLPGTTSAAAEDGTDNGKDNDDDIDNDIESNLLAASMGFSSFGAGDDTTVASSRKRKYNPRADAVTDATPSFPSSGNKNTCVKKTGSNNMPLGQRRDAGGLTEEDTMDQDRSTMGDGTVMTLHAAATTTPTNNKNTTTTILQSTSITTTTTHSAAYIEAHAAAKSALREAKRSKLAETSDSIQETSDIQEPSDSYQKTRDHQKKRDIQETSDYQQTSDFQKTRNGVWQGDPGGYFNPSFIEDPWAALLTSTSASASASAFTRKTTIPIDTLTITNNNNDTTIAS